MVERSTSATDGLGEVESGWTKPHGGDRVDCPDAKRRLAYVMVNTGNHPRIVNPI